MSDKDLQFIERALVRPWMFWAYFWKWPRIVRQACAEYDILAKERDTAKAAYERSERANKLVRDWIHVTHRLSTTPEAIRAIFAAGKRLSILLAFFIATNAFSQAPPYLRNQWTTNANPIAVKVISTNGVQAATNVWELDFTNTASVSVNVVSNAGKVVFSFIAATNSGGSSMTNTLLHAGPTNGSVGALILTAGNGVTLSTSGTNRVVAIDTNVVAEIGDILWTNWTSITSDGTTNYGSTLSNALYFPAILSVNFLNTLWGDPSAMIGLGIGHTNFPAIAATNAAITAIGDFAFGGPTLLERTFESMAIGTYAMYNSVLKNCIAMLYIGTAVGNASKFTNCQNVTIVGGGGVSMNATNVTFLGVYGDSFLNTTLRDCSLVYGYGGQNADGADFITANRVVSIGTESMTGAHVTNTSKILALGNASFANARITGGNDIVAMGDSGGTNLVINNLTNVFIFGNILNSVPVSREFWFGNTNNTYRMPGALIVGGQSHFGNTITNDTGTTNAFIVKDISGGTYSRLYTSNGVLYSSASPPYRTVDADGWPVITNAALSAQGGSAKLTNFAALADSAGVLTNDGAGGVGWKSLSDFGGGSQTPWTSDINAAGFSLTNEFQHSMRYAAGILPLVSGLGVGESTNNWNATNPTNSPYRTTPNRTFTWGLNNPNLAGTDSTQPSMYFGLESTWFNATLPAVSEFWFRTRFTNAAGTVMTPEPWGGLLDLDSGGVNLFHRGQSITFASGNGFVSSVLAHNGTNTGTFGFQDVNLTFSGNTSQWHIVNSANIGFLGKPLGNTNYLFSGGIGNDSVILFRSGNVGGNDFRIGFGGADGTVRYIRWQGTNASSALHSFEYQDAFGVFHGFGDTNFTGLNVSGPINTKNLEATSVSSQPGVKVGSLVLQCFATNNAWLGENFYYNGAFTRIGAGSAQGWYFQDGQIFTQSAGSGAAGSSFTADNLWGISTANKTVMAATNMVVGVSVNGSANHNVGVFNAGYRWGGSGVISFVDSTKAMASGTIQAKTILATNAIYAETNTAPFDIVGTDFVINTWYTNDSRRAVVSLSFELDSNTTGTSKAGIYVDQALDGTFETTKTVQALGLADPQQQSVSAWLQPGARFAITNLSSGAGSPTVAVVAGSCQWVKQ